MPAFGLIPSFAHADNGMSQDDMRACVRAADRLDEVIIFRSTGPWAQRWIEKGYPSRNFHIKGKSADWGPHAGFVPYLGLHSKVGADGDKAAAATAVNDQGLLDGFAGRQQLVLSFAELQMQFTRPAESPPRCAIYRLEAVPGIGATDYMLWARRSGDQKVFVFRAVRRSDGNYGINVLTQEAAARASLSAAADIARYEPLEVMISTEVGADHRPMTGDYELMAVCPRVGHHAGAEHPDLGNHTPRIQRCLNLLHQEMGAQGPLRRVHPIAESHRHAAFDAWSAPEMEGGDGLPLTVFQPASLWQNNAALRPYQDVSTLLTLQEFREYATLLNEAGFFVPRSWTWGMSMRHRA